MATEPGRVALPELFSRLLADGAALARAEVSFAVAKLTTRVDAAKLGASLLFAAAITAFLGLIGLVVGVVMALATLIGPGFAGMVVCLVLLTAAWIMYSIGSKRLAAQPIALGAEP